MPAAAKPISQKVCTQWKNVSPLRPTYGKGGVPPKMCSAPQLVMSSSGHCLPSIGAKPGIDEYPAEDLTGQRVEDEVEQAEAKGDARLR